MSSDLLFRLQRRLTNHLVRRRFLGPGPAGPGRLSLLLYFDYEREFGNPLARASADAGFRGLLPILDRFGIQSTWSTVGLISEAYPETLAELVARGHELACHTYSHCDLTQISKKELASELARFKERFEKLYVVTIRGFHPPRDRWTLGLPEMLRRQSYSYDIARDDDPERLHAHYLASALRTGSPEILRIPSVAADWRYITEDLDPAIMTAFWMEKIKAVGLGRTIAIGFHPWVLGADRRRLDAFEDFVCQLVADETIKTYTGNEIRNWYENSGN